MKTVVLADCKYYGGIMYNIRRNLRINRYTAAQLLGVSRKEYSAYEKGIAVLPEPVLMRLLYHAFVGMHTKHNLSRITKRHKKL